MMWRLALLLRIPKFRCQIVALRLVTLSCCGFAQFFLAYFDTVGNSRLGQNSFHSFYRSSCHSVLVGSEPLTVVNHKQKQNASIFFINKNGKVWCRPEHMYVPDVFFAVSKCPFTSGSDVLRTWPASAWYKS